MFVFAPDTRIKEHPIKIASGEWTAVQGVMEGTFSQPMPGGGGRGMADVGQPGLHEADRPGALAL